MSANGGRVFALDCQPRVWSSSAGCPKVHCPCVPEVPALRDLNSRRRPLLPSSRAQSGRRGEASRGRLGRHAAPVIGPNGRSAGTRTGGSAVASTRQNLKWFRSTREGLAWAAFWARALVTEGASAAHRSAAAQTFALSGGESPGPNLTGASRGRPRDDQRYSGAPHGARALPESGMKARTP